MKKTTLFGIAFALGVLVMQLANNIDNNKVREIICDHPVWADSGYAAISAPCGKNIIVTILD